MQPESIAIALIVVGERLRPLDQSATDGLAESIRLVGLLQPIRVTRDLDLVDGYHRLEACRKAGLREIPVLWFDGTPDEAALAECDSNLMRADLTALQRMQHLEARKTIRDAMMKPNRPRVKGFDGQPLEPEESRNDNLVVSAYAVPTEPKTFSSFDPDESPEYAPFTEEAATLTRVSQRSVQRDLHTVGRLTSEVQEIIQDTAIADSKHQMQALAAIPSPARMLEVATQARETGETVQAILGKPDSKPSPKMQRTKAKAASTRITDGERVLKARDAFTATRECGCCCEECAARMKRALA